MVFFFVSILALLALGCHADSHTNIYGEALAKCEGAHANNMAGSGEYGACTFRSYDRGAHQVCVGALPADFSYNTGQGRWSDEFEGKNWCICIWAYANWVTNQHTDLQIKCDAISSSVLDSDFAASHFRMGTRNYLDAVRNMCATCEAQAPTDKARKELEKTCAKWEATQ
jgi:hypothetical protein